MTLTSGNRGLEYPSRIGYWLAGPGQRMSFEDIELGEIHLKNVYAEGELGEEACWAGVGGCASPGR